MNSLFKKFLEFAFGNGIVLILGFISSPLITRIIVPEEFGKFSMFNTITSLLLILITLGLDQSYVRFYYEEEKNARSKLLFKSIKLPLVINIVLSIVLIILYKPVSKFVIGDYSIIIIIIIIIQNTFNIIGRFALLLIRMKQNGKAYSLIQIINKILYIIFVLLFCKVFKSDYRTLVWALVLSNIIGVLISIIIEKRVWLEGKKRIKLKTSNKEMLNFGIPLVFSMAIIWIFQSIDKVFLNIYCGYDEVGIYASAFSIISLLNALQNTFTTFWTPIAQEKFKNNPEDKDFFRRIYLIINFVMMILGILLITFKDLLVLFLGAKFRSASYIFPFLIFMPIMFTISETTVIGINFSKKTKYHIYISIISAITNIIGNFILVPIIGARGAAISTGISYIIFFVCRTLISQKIYYVNYEIKKVFINILLLCCLALYATFNNLDIVLLGFGIINLFFVIIFNLKLIKSEYRNFKKAH